MQLYETYASDRAYFIEKKRSPHKRGRLICAVFLLSAAVVAGIVVYCKFFAAKYTVAGRSYYAVVTTETSLEGQAVEAAAAVKQAGGGGYVLNDGVYRVVAAVYPDNAAATAVADRLTAGSTQASVVTLTVEKMRFSAFGNRTKNAEPGAAVGYVVGELYDKLYELSLSLDEKKIAESVAVRLLSDYRETTAGYLDRIVALRGEFPEDKTLSRLQNTFIRITEALSAAASAEAVPPASRIKYAVCATIVYMRDFSTGA